VKHRNAIAEVETPEVGKIKVFNLTAKFDKTDANVDTPPPTLSQHTEGILKELGYTEEEIKGFIESKVV
jgi:crotonobetainyl-CoA:carnitine CoA-transferase CaiB-like acyl-CoA transferase